MGVSTDLLIARRERERREREASRRTATHTCGDAGGVKANGDPCGAETPDGERCHHHPDADVMAEEAFAYEGEPFPDEEDE